MMGPLMRTGIETAGLDERRDGHPELGIRATGGQSRVRRDSNGFIEDINRLA